MTDWNARLTEGQVDVEVVPAGPGAIRVHESDVIDSEWEAADATVLVGNIADHERMSVAEITISASPYSDGTFPASVSAELMPGEIDDLIAALLACKANSYAAHPDDPRHGPLFTFKPIRRSSDDD